MWASHDPLYGSMDSTSLEATFGDPVGTDLKWVWALFDPFIKAQRNCLLAVIFCKSDFKKFQKPPCC